jgi:hypothetical protein
MPIDRSSLINSFKRIHLFRGLDDQRIGALVDMVEQVEFPAGAVIFNEGNDADYFYIVASGRVRISRYSASEQQAVLIGFREEEDYFGEEVLESNWPRKISAEAVTDVVLLRMSVPVLIAMLEQVGPLSHRLQMVLDSYRLMLRKRFNWLDPEETVYYIARRHILFLLIKILPPLALGIIFIPVLLTLFISTKFSMSILLLLLLATGVLLFWFVWSYIDWTNDYYLVTNNRVIYQERVVLFYDSRQESPMPAVQSTQTNTSQWGRWLGYGNVAIRTYIGTILFRSISMPEQVMALIQEQQARAQFGQYRSELRTIKSTIDKRIINGPQAPVPSAPPRPAAQPSPMRQFLSSMFHLRYESGGTITYRTHIIILLKKVGVPSLLLLGLALLLFASISNRFAMLSIQATCGLVFVLGLVIFGWWFYQYMDWHNDVYLITQDQVIDVNKKPLGHEQRQAAPLKNILGIEYKRLGIIGLIFNYGTVYIRVGDKQLTFDDVFKPSEVQRELFHRLTAKTNADKQAEAAAERRRLADWFATYDEWLRENPRQGLNHPSGGSQAHNPGSNPEQPQPPNTPPAPPSRGGF